MRTLKDFEARKAALLKAYQGVLDSGLLPVGDVGPKEVQERVRALEEHRFYVAVCGQMKSGKSMLLNALVFGRLVLPTDDTVMTAKNTLLCYRETPGLQIRFYNSEEWNDLTGHFQQDKQAWKDFKSEIDQAARLGVYKDECVRTEAHVAEVSSIESLREYVTPVNKGGRFTPFVKEVIVFYPHPWLKSVTVADTPGVNDPLKFREDVTKKWISRANAVIYVTYAGRALDEIDVKFLDEYLLHVASNRRIIAVNKTDCVDNMAAVESYVRSLRERGDQRTKTIFGDPHSVVYVCALGALIASAIEQKAALSEDVLLYREMLESQGFLNPANHRMDALRALVESRLLNVSGEDLILDHGRFLPSLFERAKRSIRRDLEKLRTHKEDLGRDKEDLDKERQGIERAISAVHERMTAFERDLERKLDSVFRDLREKIQQSREKAASAIGAGLRSMEMIDVIKREGPWLIKRKLEAEQRSLFKALEQTREEVEGYIRDRVNRLELELQGETGFLSIEAAIGVSLFEIVDRIRVRGSELRTEVEEAIEEATNWWQRFWETKGGLINARGEVLHLANELLEERLDEGIVKRIVDEIRKSAGNARKELQTSVNEMLEERRRELEEISAGLADRQAKIADVDNKIQQAGARLSDVERLEQEILGADSSGTEAPGGT
jgi:hypothetical protein